MATNVIYDFKQFDYADNNMVADPEDWRVVAKINDDGLWRVAYGESKELTEEQRRARISERFKRILPNANEPYELVLANSYRVHQRSAETYRSGRVLLAGDAAHATNPIGGLGLTSGVQDAALLINCLSALFHNQAADDALDWYAYERRRCFVEIASPTAIELKRRLQEREPAKRRADEAGFFAMLGNPDYKRKAMLSTFDLAGRPYREDWRQSYVAEDLRNPNGIVSGHGGVTIVKAGE
ncbi:Para-nitrophenol 4-monooxygenase [compost metagenome]